MSLSLRTIEFATLLALTAYSPSATRRRNAVTWLSLGIMSRGISKELGRTPALTF
jgi:hypothetical protein